ncbi:MAG: pyridoxal-phosphate dependent enzyme [Myxococcota bacterium]|nr:pyridoxal-phosphate dependent enzyme [Myxococcota bacterium]
MTKGISNSTNPLSPPTLSEPGDARQPSHAPSTSDTTNDTLAPSDRTRSGRQAPRVTTPQAALAPGTAGWGDDTTLANTQLVKPTRLPPALPKPSTQVREQTPSTLQETQSFMTVGKALGLTALGAAAFFLLGPLGLALPALALGADYLSHRGWFHRLLDLTFETINGRPFENPAGPVSDTLVTVGQRPHYPLAEAYGGLEQAIYTIPLCETPTPIERLTAIEDATRGHIDNKLALFVKNDGVSNRSTYGGNKPRKLELLLGQAIHSGAQEMVISGTAGSMSVLATVLHAREHGIVPRVHLTPQLPAPRVARNLVKLARLLSQPMETSTGDTKVGSISYHEGKLGAALGMAGDTVKGRLSTGTAPFVCPPGATSTLSTLGYINAMHELADDVRSGRLPEVPKKIFVPAGSGGTFIGLLIGTKTIPMFANTEIIAIGSGSGRPNLQPKKHFDDVVDYLVEQTGGEFPKLSITEAEIGRIVDQTYAGGEYGKRTEGSTEAEAIAQANDLALESTYSAKAMAKMLDQARAHHDGEEETWLFWNTNNAKSDTLPPELEVTEPFAAEDLALVREHLGEDVLREYFN